MSTNQGLMARLMWLVAAASCHQPSTDQSAPTAAATTPQGPVATSAAPSARPGSPPHARAGKPSSDGTTMVVIDPDDPTHWVACSAAAGGLWETRDDGRHFRAAAAIGGASAGRPVRRLLLVNHETAGRSLLVQRDGKGSTIQPLYRVALNRLTEGPATALPVSGRVLALATDPHPKRDGRIAALVLGGKDGDTALGSVAYSDDGGDHFRRFHPGGRTHLAGALAFGSDGHLWMATLASIKTGANAQASSEKLAQITQALIDGRPTDAARSAPRQWLRQPALLAINPQRGEVTERLVLPIDAHLISVHPGLKGTAWLAGPQGLMRLYGGTVKRVPMRPDQGAPLEPPLSPAGITVFRHPTDGTEQIFVALASEHRSHRGIWRGRRQANQWRFERVSPEPSRDSLDSPGGPVAVLATDQIAIAPYLEKGPRISHALGAAGSWTPLAHGLGGGARPLAGE